MFSQLHGTDGWHLAEYDWNEQTGMGSFLYERIVDGKTEQSITAYAQPANPSHVNWDMWIREYVRKDERY